MGSHGCDTPTTLADSMFQSVKEQNSRFSIFTGDVVEGIVAFHYLDVILTIFLAAVWLVDKQRVTSL